tara:strand:- start:124 stop:321 length:198 start_codon:yes stop_codon:yes gene_type:complete
MNVSNHTTLSTVLKKADLKKDGRNARITDIAKKRGFLDSNGNVTPKGRKFLQERMVNASLSKNET